LSGGAFATKALLQTKRPFLGRYVRIRARHQWHARGDRALSTRVHLGEVTRAHVAERGDLSES
jgi:hypothetical protein